MSFIPGRFLNPGVAQQVNARQEILGNRERLMQDGANPETFSFFIKKVPFIKLTSAIDISTEQDEDGNYINHTNIEASKFILDNGVKSAKEGDIPGYELTNDLGYRPQPGITGMQLNTHNRFGSLRTATVSFEVHSVDQLDQYEQLFMRPGYSALLEWGNSYYLDNKTKKVQEVNELLSDRFLTKESLPTKLSVYTAIDELKARYSYNYDAMYGLLKNFRWSIRPDGGYSCTVDLVSVGTVIESLNINTGVTSAQLNSYRKLLQKISLESGEEALTEDITEPQPTSEELNTGGLEFYEEVITPLITVDSGINLIRKLESVRNPKPIEFLKEPDGTEDPVTDLKLAEAFKDYETKNPVLVTKVNAQTQTFTVTSEPTVFGFAVKRNIAEERFIEKLNGDLRNTKLYTHITRTVLPSSDPNFVFVVDDLSDADLIFKHLSLRGSIFYVEYTFGIERISKAEAITRGYDLTVLNILAPQPQGPTESGAPLGDFETATDIDSDVDDLFRKFNPEVDSSIHLTLSKLRELFKREVTRSTYAEYTLSSIFTSLGVYTEYTTLLHRSKLSADTASDEENTVTDKQNNLSQPDAGMHYIQLGAFIDILNKYIPKTKQDDSEGISESLFQIHSSKSLIHRHKTLENLHASVDPAKFILPQSQVVSSEITPRGDILDIFVEISYLEEVVRAKLQDSELRVYELLTEVLEELNAALGKINSFEIQYFENTFKFHIIDRELIDPSEFTENSLVRLELIGKNSTLLNLNLTSKLSPAIGSQLAIAAQADPISNGIEGTGWAKFNKRLKDRYIPEKVEDLEELVSAQEIKEQELQEKLARVFLFLDAMYYRQEIGATGINIPSVSTEYAILCKILLNKEVAAGKDFGTIIPYELNLELEGMSGFEVMRSFIINEQIIPKVYRNEEEGIAFLITGLTHKVTAERWTVGVKAQIYNTNTKGLASVSGELNIKNRTRKPATNPPANAFTGPAPNADNLRSVLSELGYTEKNASPVAYGEISNGGDIAADTAAIGIELLRGLKSQFPQANLRVTGGNDLYHQKLNYNSKHKEGKALDFVVDAPSNLVRPIASYISSFAANKSNVEFLDEYKRQSEAATGQHFHISIV